MRELVRHFAAERIVAEEDISNAGNEDAFHYLNDECRNPKPATNSKWRKRNGARFGASSLVIDSGFVLRISSFRAERLDFIRAVKKPMARLPRHPEIAPRIIF